MPNENGNAARSGIITSRCGLLIMLHDCVYRVTGGPSLCHVAPAFGTGDGLNYFYGKRSNFKADHSVIDLRQTL